MNDMSQTLEADAPLLSQRAPEVSRLPEQLISHPCDQIVAALTRAQEEIRAPTKNKTAHIRTRDGRQYQYSYATLDAVIDAVRLPLARNGIVETALQNGERLEVLLIHTSGQWMRASMPLRVIDETQQGMNSAITTGRRIALQSMLGIAAEDDDDGSAGAGNEISNAGWQARADGDGPEGPAMEDAAGDGPRIARMARAARGLADAQNLIRSWSAHRGESERVRRDDPAAWRLAVDAVGAALDRILGGTIAGCWRSAELAETREHQKAVREAMDGKWADVLARFRGAEPSIHGDLMRHYNDRCAAIDAAPPARPAEADPSKREAPPNRETPSKRETEVARQQPAQPFRHPLIDANGWSFMNADGDDVWLSPDSWARTFEELYEAAGADERVALREHNAAAIEEASQSLGAEVILTDLFAPEAEQAAARETFPEPPFADEPAPVEPPAPSGPVPDLVVVPPRRRGGEMDKPGYLARIIASIAAHVNDADDVTAWVEANEPTYRSAGAVVGLEVLKALATRKRALGIPLPGM